MPFDFSYPSQHTNDTESMREKSTLLSFASSFVVFCNDKKTEEKEDSLKWIKYFSVNIENIGNGRCSRRGTHRRQLV